VQTFEKNMELSNGTKPFGNAPERFSFSLNTISALKLSAKEVMDKLRNQASC
jgi:hypothetical protein